MLWRKSERETEGGGGKEMKNLFDFFSTFSLLSLSSFFSLSYKDQLCTA